MDKFLARELIVEHLSNRDLIDLVIKEKTHSIEITSGLTLNLKGDRRGEGINLTIIETGQPNKQVWLTLFGDFAITTYRRYL